MPDMYPVRLTQMESLFLSDSVSMFAQAPPDALPGQSAPFPSILLKVGGAVLETDQQKTDAAVHFSLSELWVMREVTKSSVMVGNERVGISLLMKIYEGIRTLSAAPDVRSVVNALGEVVDDEPGKSEYAAQLERLREGGDLHSGGTQDDIDDLARGNNGPQRANEDGPDHDPAATA